jgi:hypothetical protein
MILKDSNQSINPYMEIHLEMVRRLPVELHEFVMKTYNNSWVLPELMDAVETKLQNKEYEDAFEQSVIVIDTMLHTIVTFKNEHEVAFEVAMDVVEDRIFEGMVSFDMPEMLDTYHILKDYISCPSMLRMMIHNLKVYADDKCAETTQRTKIIQNVYDMLMPNMCIHM